MYLEIGYDGQQKKLVNTEVGIFAIRPQDR